MLTDELSLYRCEGVILCLSIVPKHLYRSRPNTLTRKERVRECISVFHHMLREALVFFEKVDCFEKVRKIPLDGIIMNHRFQCVVEPLHFEGLLLQQK